MKHKLGYRHKNLGKYVVRINDSVWRTYDLEPGEEVVIDKPSPRDTVKVIGEEYSKRAYTRKRKEKKKVEKHIFELNIKEDNKEED
jgi:hypothetical protein